MIVILSLFYVGESVRVGKIDDFIMMGNTYNLLFNLTCKQCICQMITSNGWISALNYFLTNQTCQLFNYNASSILIQYYFNASLIFINQSAISIKIVQSNSKFYHWEKKMNKVFLYKRSRESFRKIFVYIEYAYRRCRICR